MIFKIRSFPLGREPFLSAKGFCTNLELLDAEYGGSLDRGGRPCRHHSRRQFGAPARAALDVAADLARDRSLPCGFLLEDLELPPLVHVAAIKRGGLGTLIIRIAALHQVWMLVTFFLFFFFV